MKTLITLLFSCVACFGQFNFNDVPFLVGSNTITGGAPPTYIIEDNFDETGIPTGWFGDTAGVDFDYTPTPVLSELESLMFEYGAAGDEIWKSVDGDANAHIYMMMVVTNQDADWDTCCFTITGSDHGSRAGLQLCSSMYTIRHGTAYATNASPLTLNTTYHIWFDFTKSGVGASNGIAKIYVNSTAAKPASPTLSITTGTVSEYAEFLQIGDYDGNGSGAFYIDHLRADDIEISSNPP